MEKAKSTTQEKLSELTQVSEREHRESNTNLKVDINNMIHCNLPDHITIKEAAALAETIYEMIHNPDWFVR